MLTKLFRKPTASERAAQELHAAKLDRLQAQAAAEYWKHQCAMLDERIARLECAAGGVGGALLELMRSHNEVAVAREKQTQRAREKANKAKQRDIEDKAA